MINMCVHICLGVLDEHQATNANSCFTPYSHYMLEKMEEKIKPENRNALLLPLLATPAGLAFCNIILHMAAQWAC